MQASKGRILVAEDDAGVREIVRTRLYHAGYEVRTARSGREALDRVVGWQTQALILDINMPELDGFGLLTAIKTHGFALPPTLVLTARHSSDDVRQAIQLGARDYLTKPFTEAQLMARVARLFRTTASTPRVML